MYGVPTEIPDKQHPRGVPQSVTRDVQHKKLGYLPKTPVPTASVRRVPISQWWSAHQSPRPGSHWFQFFWLESRAAQNQPVRPEVGAGLEPSVRPDDWTREGVSQEKMAAVGERF